jgi:Zn-dependent protease
MKVAPDNLRPEYFKLALLGLIVWLGSVVIHELSRLIAAHRLEGRLQEIVLRPTGGSSHAILPANPPFHLAMALVGPMAHVVLIVVAACGLVVAGEPHLLELFRPFAPDLQVAPRLQLDGSTLLLGAQLTVWINAWLLLINMLPVEPQDGWALARAFLWPVVGQASTNVILRRVAIFCAILAAVMAIMFSTTVIDQAVPAWLPLAVLAILLGWSGGSDGDSFHEEISKPIDPLLSEEDLWLPADWLEEEATKAILVEQIHDKRQEVLDQKRRVQEANEDARVDAILARLQSCRFDQLPEEDRTILKRASRRYRKRLSEPEHEV